MMTPPINQRPTTGAIRSWDEGLRWILVTQFLAGATLLDPLNTRPKSRVFSSL